MQRRKINNIEELQQLVASTPHEPTHVTLPEGKSGVWLSRDLWDRLQNQSRAQALEKSTSLEKAVSLLIQESKNSEEKQLAAARREEQFVRVFSMSLTPMRIEDWTTVKALLDGLGQRNNPIEIKEHLLANPNEIRSALASVTILDCNNAFREAVDAQHNPDYLNSLESIVPDDCYPQIANIFLQLWQGATDIHENVRIRRFDGGLRDIQMHLSLYSDVDDKESKMLVSYWDITQQKRITRHLQSEEEADGEERSRSMLALNSIREGVITTDQNGNIINLNPTAKRITGWQTDYFQRPLDTVFAPHCDRFHSINNLLDASRKSGKAQENETVCQLTGKDGEEYWIRFNVTPILSDEIISGFIIIFHDVSESKQLLEQIKEHKNQDPITSLLNRQSFRAKLAASIKQAKTSEGFHALLLVDLDQFHIVNDSCGHTAGDLLLADIAQLLRALVRADDSVARIGGDEFGILLQNCGADAANRIANNLLDKLKDYRFSYDGKLFKVGASVGIVLIDQTVKSVDKLLVDAGSVVQLAKDNGSNRVEIYDEEQEVLLKKQDELRWFTKITHALENDHLVLSYQKISPLAALDSGEDVHYEILLRMLDDDGSVIGPGQFMPAAERYHLMPEIDRWVVKHAFQWIEINLHRSQSVSLFSINLSGHSIGEESFLNYVDECFDKFYVPGERICFEITETMAINNMKNTLRFMERFKKIGCKFSLDDFGTGFSSYGYLKNLPVDFLKIDGSFVSKIASDPIDLAMVKSINEVGHVMNRKTIAEYVENDETIALLKEMGVDYVQGFGIERPQLLGAKPTTKKTGT